MNIAKPKSCAPADVEKSEWYRHGYAYGVEFAGNEADYEELVTIVRANEIPAYWDIFRAEIVNRYLDDPLFDFQAFSEGFAAACIEFFNNI